MSFDGDADRIVFYFFDRGNQSYLPFLDINLLMYKLQCVSSAKFFIQASNLIMSIKLFPGNSALVEFKGLVQGKFLLKG